MKNVTKNKHAGMLRVLFVMAAVLLLAAAGVGAASAADTSGLPTKGDVTAGTYVLTDNVQLTGILAIKGDVTIDLNGSTITAKSGNRLFDVSGGTFTLNDSKGGGKLQGNGQAGNYCGGVYIKDSGSFIMNGGNITGCQRTGGNGGGVNVYLGSFTMNGGNITSCSASSYGGGVFVDSGANSNKFTMTGGSIEGCSGKIGGGVYIMVGTFTMSGGTIKNCSVSGNNCCGGGVYISNSNSISYSSFQVSGSAVITGNTKESSANNVYLGWLENPNLFLTDNFTGSIGIVFAGNNNPSAGGRFGTATGTYTGAENFFADNNNALAGSLVGTDLKWTKKVIKYVEVTTWNELVTAASEWTKTDEMRTIVVKNNVVNNAGSVGSYEGIPITGNISIMPAANTGEIKIDGGEMGRIFKVSSGGNLTLSGNYTGQAVSELNLTGGNFGNFGGAIEVRGYLTMNANVTIAGNVADNGGGVFLSGASAAQKAKFVMNGGTIKNNRESSGYYGGGGIMEWSNAVFVMNDGLIANNSARCGGGVESYYNTAEIEINGGTIAGNYAELIGGGIFYSNSNGNFVMRGGKIAGNSAGTSDAEIYTATTINVSGTAEISGNSFALLYAPGELYVNISVDGTYTGNIDNITIYDLSTSTVNPAGRLGQVIVENGAAYKDHFSLSPEITGYTLEPSGENLILATSPYIEVSSWNALVTAASAWTVTENMCTIVVMNNVANETAGSNYAGIPVTGNITIKPADTGSEIKIDAAGFGRLFDVKSGANLIITGNSSTILNVTGGYMSGSDGGAVSVNSGAEFTLAENAKITNSSVNGAGGVAVRGGGVSIANNGIFTMTGGSISGCSANDGDSQNWDAVYGGGVFSAGTFTMSGGTIDNCSANGQPENTKVFGGGVSIREGTFTMTGSAGIENCRAVNGGGVFDYNTFIMEGGSIKDCSATGNGGGVLNSREFIMTGGSIEGCSAGNGTGVYSSDTFTMSGTAAVDGVYLESKKKITLSSAFTAAGAGVKNITLAGDAADWVNRTIIEDGASAASSFTLVPELVSAYKLEAGTGAKASDLILVKRALTYVEVNSWDELVQNASEWKDVDETRIIVLTNTAEGAYKNTTAGTCYSGIPITGNVTIKPAEGASEIKIDGAGYGRLFNIADTGSLTLAGNSTAVLNITGGKMTGTTPLTTEGGAVAVSSGGKFILEENAKITSSTAIDGGAVMNYGTFTMNGGSISGCSAANGGGICIANSGTFTMKGGSIDGCSAQHGSAVCINYAYDGSYTSGTFIINGTASVAENNDVFLNGSIPDYAFLASITLGDGGFTAENAGVKNITLAGTSAEGWVGKTIINGGASAASNFTLAPSLNSYVLKTSGSNLVLSYSPYVEVNDWASLNKSVAEWTSTTDMRIVVVTGNITDRKTNPVENADGIKVSGLVTVTVPAGPGDEYRIAGASVGRLFKVENGGNLTLTGNASRVLNLTGGSVSEGNGGAALITTGGKLTLDTDAKITGSSASYGGAVYINGGAFIQNGGSIEDCSVSNNGGSDDIFGGAVYVANSGTFTMKNGRITGCSAIAYGNAWDHVFGGAVYIANNAAFIMEGGSIDNTSAKTTGSNWNDVSGGAVYVKGTFTLSGGLIDNCSANDGGAVFNDGTFAISGSAGIKNSSAANNGGAVYNTYQFTMTGGSIEGCSAVNNGSGVYNTADRFTVSGTAVISDEVHLTNYITLGTGGFTAQNAGVKNISLDGGDIETWLAKTIVYKGASAVSNFTLSSKYTGYKLDAGTGARVNDLVLNRTEYNITYELDGGINDPSNPQTYNISSTVSFSDASKTGYTFEGWYNDSSCAAANKTYGISAGSTGDVTVWANYTINSYTVTFNPENGDGPWSEPVEYNTTVSEPEDPELTGYTFQGWNETSASGTPFDFNTKITDNISLYANYTIDDYIITYELDGGTNGTGNPASYRITTPTITLEDASKKGYTFEGWYNDTVFTEDSRDNTIPEGSTGDKTFYANYTAKITEVTFYNETVTHTKKFTYDQSAPAAVGIKTGHTFEGWYDASGVQVFDDMGVLNTSAVSYVNATDKWGYDGTTLSLWANYSVNSYYVVFNPENGTAEWQKPVKYNTTVAKPTPDPTKTGYTFQGWNETSAMGTPFNFSTRITDDVFLYANYTANVTTVTFNNETVPHNKQFTYDQTASTAVGIKAGHTFLGWYDGTGVQVFNDTGALNTSASAYVNATDKWGYDGTTLSLWANYSVNYYNVTFNPENETQAWNVSVEYNTTVTQPANPTKTGYTFRGWNESSASGTPFDFSTKITGDTALYANYTIDGYTINYVLNGGTNATGNPATYNVTTPTITLGDATKTGYTFEGWYNSSVFTEANKTNTIPQGSTGDKTFYANYTIIEYNIDYVLNGGTNATGNPASYNVTTPTITLDAATKTGYTFEGWYNSSVFTEANKTNTIPLGSTGAKTFYANYTANVTTVTFNNGTVPHEKEFTYDQSASAAVGIKAGHTFLGWYDGTGIQVFNDTGVLNTSASAYVTSAGMWGYEGAALSLWANYTIIEYNIDYELDGGTNATGNPASYNVTTPTITLGDATKTGYTFEGWYNSSVFTEANKTNTIPLGSTGAKTFYANYTANVTDVTFYNGTVQHVKQFTYNQTAEAEAGIDIGKIFTGWYDGSGVQVFNDTGALNTSAAGYVTSAGMWGYEGAAVSLYANYTANQTILNLTGANGESFEKRIETFGVYNSTISPQPSKTNCDFLGWNVSDNPTVQLINAAGQIQKVAGYTNTTTGAWENSTLPDGTELQLDAVWKVKGTVSVNNDSYMTLPGHFNAKTPAEIKVTYNYTGLDGSDIYLNDVTAGTFTWAGTEVHLNLNATKSNAGTGLTSGTDYTYNSATTQLTINADAHPTTANTAVFYIEGYRLGDITQDGRVNLADALFIARNVGQGAAQLGEKFAYGNIYNNGNVLSINDAVAISKYNVELLNADYKQEN